MAAVWREASLERERERESGAAGAGCAEEIEQIFIIIQLNCHNGSNEKIEHNIYTHTKILTLN